MGGFRHAFFFNAPAAAINLCGIKPRPSEGLPDVQGPAGLNCASIRALRLQRSSRRGMVPVRKQRLRDQHETRMTLLAEVRLSKLMTKIIGERAVTP